MPTDDTP